MHQKATSSPPLTTQSSTNLPTGRCAPRACSDDYRKWWCPCEVPDHEILEVEIVQFMNKDNVPLHTIVFPSTLLASGKKWKMLHHLSTSEYLQYEGGNLSKSRSIGVFGNDAKDTGIPTEVWRYYLLVNRPESSDSALIWADLATKNNDELINNLGNFINRTVTFLWTSFDGVVPDVLQDDEQDAEFIANINKEPAEYVQVMDKVSLKAGLKKAMAISSIGNLYLQRKAPWKLPKQKRTEEAGGCLVFAAHLAANLAAYLAAYLAALVTVVLGPFLGTRFSEKVFTQLGIVHSPGFNNVIPDTFAVPTWVVPGQRNQAPKILFISLQPPRVKELRAKYGGESANGADGDDAKKGR